MVKNACPDYWRQGAASSSYVKIPGKLRDYLEADYDIYLIATSDLLD